MDAVAAEFRDDDEISLVDIMGESIVVVGAVETVLSRFDILSMTLDGEGLAAVSEWGSGVVSGCERKVGRIIERSLFGGFHGIEE